jgi:hypothetical protein
MQSIVRLATCSLLASLMSPGGIHAQTLTPRLLGQVSGKAEKEPNDFQKGADNAENKSGVSSSGVALLPQADVSVGNGTTQLGLQAVDLFFNKDWRLYVRSTLPIPKDKSSSTPAAAASEPATVALDDAAIAALLDPYGGVLNLSTGSYTQFPFLKPRSDDVDHGLFLDARLGMKLLTLPNQSATAPTVLDTSVTPFYTGAVILKLVRNVYGAADGKDVAGGFEFGLGYVVNVVADRSNSSVFADGLLDRTTHAVRLDLALSLTSIAAINISWNPWSNNDFGKRFVVGIKLLNQKPAVGGGD